jgi:hypothetical protein
MKKIHVRHYLVMTEFNQIVHSTEDLEEAKRECAEWAEWDDIWVGVYDSQAKSYELIYQVEGYSEAVDILYPETDSVEL